MAKTFREARADFGIAVVIERGDGYYWQCNGLADEHGPFVSAIDAMANMKADDLDDFGDSDAEDEAEFGVGAAAWLDPETGFLPEDTTLHPEDCC